MLARPSPTFVSLLRPARGIKTLATSIMRPSRIAVDYDVLAGNYLVLQNAAGPGVTVVPTIKADAYGHGAVNTARVCHAAGAKYFSVAALAEAIELREAGIKDVPILVMSYIPVRYIKLAAAHDITVTIYDESLIQAYNAELDSLASPLKKPLKSHLKVDTGMGRLGVLPQNLPPLLKTLKACKHLEVEGIYSHFSRADDDQFYTDKQCTVFADVAKWLASEGWNFKFVHMANSAAALTSACPSVKCNLFRTGIALYGCVPGPLVSMLPGLKQAMTWSSEVAQVKTLPPQHPIGYGNTYTTKDQEVVALVPVGYSDGFRRGPLNPGEVLIGGRKCPIRGRVSMEKTVVSVQHLINDGIHVRIGDEVVLLGQQGDAVITAEDIAGKIGTINYEVLTTALARVPRQH